MTILSAILMLNIKFQKPKLFFIVIGILLSVLIYYINFFFGALGKNEKLPLLVSIWIPIIILTIISIIGMIRINENNFLNSHSFFYLIIVKQQFKSRRFYF